MEQGKIDLGLPRTAWTPHRDSASHEIYPIPEYEEERNSNSQQHTPVPRGNAPTRERTSRSVREPDPPPQWRSRHWKEVLEPQEEEEEEMNQVTLVEMKDQIGMKVPTPMRKKMKVVLIQQE